MAVTAVVVLDRGSTGWADGRPAHVAGRCRVGGLGRIGGCWDGHVGVFGSRQVLAFVFHLNGLFKLNTTQFQPKFDQ